MAARRSAMVDVGTEALIAVGTLVWSAQRAQSRQVTETEERIFRAFNDRSDTLHPAAWLVMQSGSYAAVFVAAGSVWRTEGLRRAAGIVVLGTAVWGGVKMIKPSVGRGRPDAHLEGVSIRGAPQRGLGFPSGHAAVSMTLALVLTDPGHARRIALATAATTGATRMYVGAHLPLDVAGGFAIGLLTRSVGRVIRRF